MVTFTEQAEYKLGVFIGEVLAELFCGFLTLSGATTVSIAAVSVYRVSSTVAKLHKRTDFSPTTIFEDAIDAVTDAY